MLTKLQSPLITMYLFAGNIGAKASVNEFELRDWQVENKNGQTRLIKAQFPNMQPTIQKTNKIER
jgi:hypothetical protein